MLLRELQHIADVPDEDVLPGHAHGHGQARVLAQVLLLAVDRDEVLGLCQGLHHLQLLLAGVDVVHALVDDGAVLL